MPWYFGPTQEEWTSLVARVSNCQSMLRVLTKMQAQEVIREGFIMATATEVLAKVSDTAGVVDSVLVYVAELKVLVEQGKLDPAKLDEAIALLDTSKAKLVGAITATPAPGEVVVTP